MNELVSIIIPYYNASKYIQETIDSIINQTYKIWEILIIDDCSTEKNTKKILDSIASLDERIKILKTPHNCGAGAARNIGIKSSNGRYLAFCDSDDWWYPSKLEEQLVFMQKNKHEMTCTYYEDANISLEPYYIVKQKYRQNYKDLIKGCNIGTPGVIIDTKRIGKKEMPSLRRAEDWGYWMVLLKEIDYIYTCPKVLWKYRHVSNSETSNKFKMLKSVINMYSIVLKFSKLEAYLICFFIFLPNNILKKVKKFF